MLLPMLFLETIIIKHSTVKIMELYFKAKCNLPSVYYTYIFQGCVYTLVYTRCNFDVNVHLATRYSCVYALCMLTCDADSADIFCHVLIQYLTFKFTCLKSIIAMCSCKKNFIMLHELRFFQSFLLYEIVINCRVFVFRVMSNECQVNE